jgi:hypothetical protein
MTTYQCPTCQHTIGVCSPTAIVTCPHPGRKSARRSITQMKAIS